MPLTVRTPWLAGGKLITSRVKPEPLSAVYQDLSQVPASSSQ